jgi:hypothetical protein
MLHALPHQPAPSFHTILDDYVTEKPFSLRDVLTTAPDLRSRHLPARPAILGEWLREGDFGYIFAPRGHGKSWIAMMLANAIASNAPLGLWYRGEKPLRVAYFDAEKNLPDIQQRTNFINATSRNFLLLQNELVFAKLRRALNIAQMEDQMMLSEMLDDGDVFIIDNLSTAASGMAENDNDAFDAIKDWLLQLRSRKITVIIIHHAGRSGEMRGASRREDMAHWIISLRQDTAENGTTAWITQFKKCRNCASTDAPPLRWTMQITDGTAEITCAKHSGTDAMLALIREGVEAPSDIAVELGVSNGCVSKWAKKLASAGLIMIRQRKYTPV